MQDCCNSRPTEHASPDEDLLLQKYFEDRNPVGWILDSYNYVYLEGLKQALESRRITLSNGRRARFVWVRCNKPSIDHMTAILEERDYSGEIIVKLVIESASGKILDESEENPLMWIPIPVRSALCLNPFTRSGDIAMIRDPGGYFVVRQRRVVILYEKLRWSTLRIDFVSKQDVDMYTVKQIDDISDITTSASTTHSYVEMSIKRKRGTTSVTENPIVKTSIDKSAVERVSNDEEIGEVTFTVLEQLFLAYYYLTDASTTLPTKREIVAIFEDHFEEILPAEHLADCYMAFGPTKLMFLSGATDLDKLPLTFLKALWDTATPDDAARVLRTGFFPGHRELEDKTRMLTTMTARVLQAYTKKIPIHDPNSWVWKCVYSPGNVILDLFRRKLSGAIIKLRKKPALLTSETAQAVLNLFATSNLGGKFLSDFMNDAGKKGRGGGGAAKRGDKKKVQLITQEIMPDNTLELYLLLTKTKANSDKHSTNMLPRNLQASGYGVYSRMGITDSDAAGLVKFRAIFTEYTQKTSKEDLINTILTHKIAGETVVVRKRTAEQRIPVMVNSFLVGYTNECGYYNLRYYKRYGLIDRKTTIAWTVEGCINIFCSPNRPVRPSLVTGKSGKLRIYERGDEWKRMTFSQLIKQGYVEYIDIMEFDGPQIRLAQTFESFSNNDKWFAYAEKLLVRLASKNNTIALTNLQRQITNRRAHPITHADLHPMGGYGIVDGMAAYLTMQQPCRTAFDMKMITQIIAQVLDNPYAIEEGFTNPYVFTRMIDTGLARAIGAEELHGGIPLVVAIFPLDTNQEDAVVINKNAIDNGLLRFFHNTVVKRTLENENQHFGRFIVPDRNQSTLRFINPNGLPSVGAVLTGGAQVISKFEEVTNDRSFVSRKDKSAYLSPDECGVVKDVVTFYSTKSGIKNDNAVCAKVRLATYRRLQDGDKITIDQAQKFVTSVVVPGIDLPFVQHVTVGQDGVARATKTEISAIINPLCVPTRMTNGTLLSQPINKAFAGTGRVTNVGPHRKLDFFETQEALLKQGYHYSGEEFCVDGITGETIQCPILIGPRTVSILKHIGELKMQYRQGTGPVNKITRQAKADEEEGFKKGEKYSEYERVASLKAGSQFIIDERMNTSCDAYTIVVCRSCSNYAKFDKDTKKFVCRECLAQRDSSKSQNELFGKYMMPYTSVYEQFLLTPLHTLIKPRFVSRDEYLMLKTEAVDEETDLEGITQEQDEEDNKGSDAEDGGDEPDED